MFYFFPSMFIPRLRNRSLPVWRSECLCWSGCWCGCQRGGRSGLSRRWRPGSKSPSSTSSSSLTSRILKNEFQFFVIYFCLNISGFFMFLSNSVSQIFEVVNTLLGKISICHRQIRILVTNKTNKTLII